LPAPLASSQPRLAAGCRWGKQGEDRVVLFPEGVMRLQGTGQSVLELCDGERTLQQIVEILTERYSADKAKIQEDVSGFLQALQQKRVVDY
jgi:pyrroloquinoline quinone biosynthesis protein D